ncbi:MAG: efflux RND transporter periplasmic adaptor subunit [Methylobacter sp.]|jgi:Cu(I)/Ag(I) efflux system membrane fusion protein|nr:efflux RND transporter periplasmic adaptor subunit [Methylobacter sp.]
MNKAILFTALVATGLGAAGGYWLALQHSDSTAATAGKAEQKPVFYRHPMNPAVTSPVPIKDEMGMDYIPVYKESAPTSNTGSAVENSTSKPEKKILYYRNPMGLPDTSSVPKKDSMSMDYIPVFAEGENHNEAQLLHVSTEKIQRLGVKTAPVENTRIAHTVRAVGIVEADEQRLYNVTLRFNGFIEQLYVNTTGQSVTLGQPLFDLYSPELVSAQHEYLTARNSQSALGNSEAWLQSGMKNLTESSLERLRNWGISESELMHLKQQGKVRQAVVVRSPATGIIMEKSVVAGARAMAGDTLFKIADLSQVWIIAEVYEQDIGLITLGQTVLATFDAYPGRTFKGKVGFIYPTLNPATRTVKVRVELPNPNGLLKPMMYAQLEIATQAHTALAVPRSAVLESGRRTLVLVDRGEGRFEPRPVKIGIRGEEMTEILEGLHEQERVVVSANFLIDAESNLDAALGGFEPANAKTSSTIPAEPPSPPAGEQEHQGGM